MTKLPYLVQEINAAIEVYLTGRTGQQYSRTAFILCDDGAELAGKLFLITDTPNWSDQKAGGRYKNFREVTAEVRGVFSTKRHTDLAAVSALLSRIEDRRDRRNGFFHSTQLLDLTIHARACVEAFVDLLDYGKLLFPNEWDAEVANTYNMETCEAVLRIDKKSFTDPSVGTKLNAVLKRHPRTGERPGAAGCEVAHRPEDFHLRLAIRNGSKDLRDKLRALV